MDNLPRLKSGVRKEVAAQRDLGVSNWHRENLPSNCYCTDVDFLEYRFDDNGQIALKLIIEFKPWHCTGEKYVLSANTRAIYSLSKAAKLPFIFAWHYPAKGNPEYFRLYNVTHFGISQRYLENSLLCTAKDFACFIRDF